jgi:hypothetical protein
MVLAIVMPSLAFTVVCVRLYVRLFVVHSCGRDDWLILAAAVGSSHYHLLRHGLICIVVFIDWICYHYRINTFWIRASFSRNTQRRHNYGSIEMELGCCCSRHVWLLLLQDISGILPTAPRTTSKDRTVPLGSHGSPDPGSDLGSSHLDRRVRPSGKVMEFQGSRNLLAWRSSHDWPIFQLR